MAKSTKKVEKQVAKVEKKEDRVVKAEPKKESTSKEVVEEYSPSETTIKEMMLMKNVDYDEAVHILQNPTPHETGEERSLRLSKLK